MSESEIVTCECGAKLRLPDDANRRSLRCPRCKAEISSAMLRRRNRVMVRTKHRAQGSKCPICQTTIDANEAVVECPECEQFHHSECWDEVGGCSTYGCSKAPALEKADPSRKSSSGWGDTKKCPVCGEKIKSIAMKCRYCKTEFNSIDPMTARDLARQAQRQRSRNQLKQLTVGLFIMSFIGCLAPITGIGGACLFLPKRDELKECGPVYQVMVYAALGLSAIYCVMIVVGVLMTVFY